ncbi:SIMPL domain-containing protein [Sphingomonas sp. RB56-2]|uniref:SIMPL domain-containing protein n=1 Tax=Sphingomonas brevis TaxID=2908206 RepID=A0ABT0SB57_9SPHN|nr:SIMPL domain-containing protein [Sphingomonas brevis]MCL6741350.1 SIMPL domain-containing protein [Sphingomonas brevis]
MLERFQGDRAALLGAVGIFSLAMVGSGYLLGDGLRRAKMADRSVSVRGVSERDVTADLATWTVSFSEKGDTLAPVQQTVDRQASAVREFFQRAGFKPDEIRDTGISVNQSYYYERKEDKVTVSRSIQLKSRKVMAVQAANSRQADLIRAGVPINSSDLNYTFTKLNDIKPAMIAEANQAARRNAEQFAKDSGASVGAIKSASQGYFSVGPRDGDSEREGDSGGSGSPFQKIRVVTTVDYDIDAG